MHMLALYLPAPLSDFGMRWRAMLGFTVSTFLSKNLS